MNRSLIAQNAIIIHEEIDDLLRYAHDDIMRYIIQHRVERAQRRYVELFNRILTSFTHIGQEDFTRAYPAIELGEHYSIAYDWPLERMAYAAAALHSLCCNAPSSGSLRAELGRIAEELESCSTAQHFPKIICTSLTASSGVLKCIGNMLYKHHIGGSWNVEFDSTVNFRLTMPNVTGFINGEQPSEESFVRIFALNSVVCEHEENEHRLRASYALLHEANLLEERARKEAQALRSRAAEIVDGVVNPSLKLQE